MEKELQGLLTQLNQHINIGRALTTDLESMAVQVKNILSRTGNPVDLMPDANPAPVHVDYAKGFYWDEGGFRWISSEGDLTIPAIDLQQPSQISFTLSCATPNCYEHFPFDVSIFADDAELLKLTFDETHQSHPVQMTVSEVAEDLHLRIHSDEFFVPSKLGGGSTDERSLSVQFKGLTIQPLQGDQGAGQEQYEEPPAEDEKIEPQLSDTDSRPAGSSEEISSYGLNWDEYVRNSEWYAVREPSNKGRTDLVYPGDEWGDPKMWRQFSDKFLRPFLPDDSSGIAVEIGQGSGKYTLEVMDKVKQILCFDVSQEFINIAQKRLAEYYESGKVKFELLTLKDCNEIPRKLKSEGLIPKVDLFFSIDSMVHVELHTLMAYFITASQCLKMGGHMTMGVASCTNDLGFARLVEEVPWYYGGWKKISHQFYFLSKDIVYYIADKLGFEIVVFEETRDINFTAKKVREVDVKF